MVLHEGAASAGCTPRRPDFNWNRNSIPQPRHCFELVWMRVGPTPNQAGRIDHGAAVAPSRQPFFFGFRCRHVTTCRKLDAPLGRSSQGNYPLRYRGAAYTCV